MRSARRVGKIPPVFIGLGVVALAVGGYGVRRLMKRVPSDPYQQVIFYEQRAVDQPDSPAVWRSLAEAYVKTGQLAQAPRAYRKAAQGYERLGDIDAAVVLENLAQRYTSEARIYIARSAPSKPRWRLARNEPAVGCYLGAFVEHERTLPIGYSDEYNNRRRDPGAFNERMGVKHAIFFNYFAYGKKFPRKWVEHLKKIGAVPQIAWEPSDLHKVQQDGYLRTWAREAKAAGVPIFLRFASEMNGDWTPYHGDPELYKEKFRLVTKMMREEAPNVAMVWCPFEMPQKGIEAYYPGEEWTDWVGVNIYSVPFNDNDRNRNAEWRNPADQLRFFYGKYAAKHPIMIAEYAASHLSSLDNKDRTGFAVDKVTQFYTALPRLYPRVKAVCWLSMNAIEHAIPGRQKNDYSLLRSPEKAKRYREMTASPYFLKDYRTKSAPVEHLPLEESNLVNGIMRFSAWTKTWHDRPTIIWSLNGRERQRLKGPSAAEWEMDTVDIPVNRARVGISVRDTNGRETARSEIIVYLRRPPGVQGPKTKKPGGTKAPSKPNTGGESAAGTPPGDAP